MSGEVDEFVRELESRIEEEMKSAYGEVVFERWRVSINMGALDDPDGYALLKGRCGDTMEIFLQISDGRVSNATFKTDGCGSSRVCGSFAAEMALGHDPDEVLEITGDAVLKRVGSLPSADNHCAFLAAETLQEAVHNFMLKQKTR